MQKSSTIIPGVWYELLGNYTDQDRSPLDISPPTTGSVAQRINFPLCLVQCIYLDKCTLNSRIWSPPPPHSKIPCSPSWNVAQSITLMQRDQTWRIQKNIWKTFQKNKFQPPENHRTQPQNKNQPHLTSENRMTKRILPLPPCLRTFFQHGGRHDQHDQKIGYAEALWGPWHWTQMLHIYKNLSGSHWGHHHCHQPAHHSHCTPTIEHSPGCATVAVPHNNSWSLCPRHVWQHPGSQSQDLYHTIGSLYNFQHRFVSPKL